MSTQENTANAPEGTKFTLTPRQKKLLPLVMLGAFFEGFDFMVISLILPKLATSYNLLEHQAHWPDKSLAIIALGAFVAFFVVRYADRIGRRPIFLSSVIIYSVASLLTAFSPTFILFVICQFIARVFLIVCWAVGFIIVVEEFDDQRRGRAIGLFQGAAAIGAIFPNLLLPVVVNTSFGWQGLYIIGALPLLVIFFFMKNLPETQQFALMKEGKVENRPSMFAVFAKPYRKYIFAVMALWFFMYLCYTSAMNFYAMRLENELLWDSTKLGLSTALAFLIGLLGYVAVGKCLDALGRKKTAYIFYGLGAVCVIAFFQSSSYIITMVTMILAIFFIGTFTVVSATFTNELFPVELRGNSTAWGNNLVGRIGPVVAPLLVSFMATETAWANTGNGYGNAVAVMALAGFICMGIVFFFMPEPKGFEPTPYEPAKK